MRAAKTTTVFRSRLRRPAVIGAVCFIICAIAAGVWYVALRGDSTPYRPAIDVLHEGTWSHLPGSRLSDGRLNIQPAGFAIVNQDGSGGQTNPPVNLYGSHLEVRDGFKLSAVIHNPHGAGVGIQLYGQPPIIADEFRVERASVQLHISGTTLTIRRWTSAAIEPTAEVSLPLPAATDLALDVTDTGGLLAFSANGRALGSVPAGDIFGSHQVWFGFDAAQADWTLDSLQASSRDGLRLNDTSAATSYSHDSRGLQNLASQKRPGFTVGAAMALGPAVSDPEYARVAFDGNFGAMTTQNALKWQFVEPSAGQYDFREGDALVALAAQHGLQIHGHTLVFGEANPHWVTDLPVTTTADKQHVRDVMTDHITTLIKHYAGKISSWDVVNEPLAPDDPLPAGQPLRDHLWYQAMGEDYIATAFRTARAADPHARLFINEYGLEADGDRWTTFLALVTRLKQQGVPVDGVGFQAHVYEADDQIDPGVLKAHIDTLGRLGLKVRISEMDVYTDDGPDVQASQYTAVFKTCLADTNCIGFTTWDISDRNDVFKDDDGRLAFGHDYLWDDRMQPTPAVASLRQVIAE